MNANPIFRNPIAAAASASMPLCCPCFRRAPALVKSFDSCRRAAPAAVLLPPPPSPSSASNTQNMASFVPCTPVPLAHRAALPRSSHASAPLTVQHPRRAAVPTTAPRPPVCNGQQPDFSGEFDPAKDQDYVEVQPFSFGPVRRDDAIITLRPTSGGPTAFRMSITPPQLDAIRSALAPRRPKAASQQSFPPDFAPTYIDPVSASSFSPFVGPERPSTHDLLHAMMHASSAIVTQAAITHIHNDVFVARVWMRGPGGLTNLDARPSDAVALALRSRAPLFLRRGLLAAWGAPVSALRDDSAVELVSFCADSKSTRCLRDEVRRQPAAFGLAKLRMRLDMAVRLERFSEAAEIQQLIRDICPIDELQLEVEEAIRDERFLDAARLRDEIVEWRAKLRRWEREGQFDM